MSLSVNSFILFSFMFPPLFSNSLFAISSDGAKGSKPEYSFIANAPPWWIWFITNAPCDFIIFALSDKEGMSLSLNARGWHTNAIPSWLTAVAPTMYKPIFFALSFKYSLSSLFIVPSGLEPNKVNGAIAKRFGTVTLLFKVIFSNSFYVLM